MIQLSPTDPVARLLAHCHGQPDHPAVVTETETVTYGEFGDRVRQFASAVVGVGEAPKVLIQLPQGANAYAAMFGALMAGGFYAPIDVAAPPARRQKIFESFGPDVVITKGELESNAPVIDPSQIDLPGLEAPKTPHELAYVIFTSGSTGEPKGVNIPRDGLAHYAAWAIDAMEVTPADRWSQHPNIAFDLSVLDIYGALCGGATLYPLISQKDRLFPADMIRRNKLTIWDSVPSVIDLMQRTGQVDAEHLSSLRLATFCGEPLLGEHLDALFGAHGALNVHNTYGPTEATVSCTLIELNQANYREAIGTSVALGEAIPGMGLHLVDGPDENEGEIVLSGPQVAKGYWQDAERSKAAFVELEIDGKRHAVYRTGDWGAYRGGNLFFGSRTDRQVKIHGHRLELGEVDAAMRACGATSSCTVLAGGELHGFVEGIPQADIAGFRKKLQDQLPAYAVPRELHPTAALPRNANDKIDSGVLTRQVEQEMVGQ